MLLLLAAAADYSDGRTVSAGHLNKGSWLAVRKCLSEPAALIGFPSTALSLPDAYPVNVRGVCSLDKTDRHLSQSGSPVLVIWKKTSRDVEGGWLTPRKVSVGRRGRAILQGTTVTIGTVSTMGTVATIKGHIGDNWHSGCG